MGAVTPGQGVTLNTGVCLTTLIGRCARNIHTVDDAIAVHIVQASNIGSRNIENINLVLCRNQGVGTKGASFTRISSEQRHQYILSMPV